MIRLKFLSITLTAMMMAVTATAETTKGWTTTWAAAAEFTGESDMPAKSLSNRSIREIVKVSIGGSKIRLRLSNEFSATPLRIKSVFIADVKDSCDINSKSAKYVTFNKKRDLTIQPGQALNSDIITYNLKPLQRLAITICYGDKTPVNATSHRGSRTTSYIVEGAATPKTSFAVSERLEHWYNIASIDVEGDNGCIAIIGNSITDGRGSTTDKQNRWPDIFSASLQDKGIRMGVANLGIGGNSVFFGGLSQPAQQRFDRDVLGQTNVKYVIVFEGVNDIGSAENDAEIRAKKIIEVYQEFIDKCHERGIMVIGGTIMPFKHSFYEGHFKEAARQYVNSWIRTEGHFDGVIDFDELMHDSNDPSALKEDLQSDWLHPNAKGYKVMGTFAAEKFLSIIQQKTQTKQ